MTESKEKIAKTLSKEEKLARLRAAYGTVKNKYNVKQEPGFYYHASNVSRGQDIDREKLGYERVVDENGNTVVFDARNGEKQVLMRIPLEDKALIDQINEEKTAEQENGIREAVKNSQLISGNPLNYVEQ